MKPVFTIADGSIHHGHFLVNGVETFTYKPVFMDSSIVGYTPTTHGLVGLCSCGKTYIKNTIIRKPAIGDTYEPNHTILDSKIKKDET